MNNYELAIAQTLHKIQTELGIDTKLMTTTESEFDRIIDRDRARAVDQQCDPDLIEEVEYPDPEIEELENDNG